MSITFFTDEHADRLAAMEKAIGVLNNQVAQQHQDLVEVQFKIMMFDQLVNDLVTKDDVDPSIMALNKGVAKIREQFDAAAEQGMDSINELLANADFELVDSSESSIAMLEGVVDKVKSSYIHQKSS